MAGGDSYGVALSASESSASSMSGATDISGGSLWGGTPYGPGSVVTLNQQGSLLPTANSTSWLAIAVGIAAVAVIGSLVWHFSKRGKT